MEIWLVTKILYNSISKFACFKAWLIQVYPFPWKFWCMRSLKVVMVIPSYMKAGRESRKLLRFKIFSEISSNLFFNNSSVIYKSKYHCHMCKMLLPPTFEVDHIVELCDGGKDEYSNLQALCPIIVMHWRPVRTSYVEIKHLRRNLERDLIWCKPIHLKSLSINLNNLSIFHRENIRSLLLY